MDVSELLAPDPGNSTRTIILFTSAAFTLASAAVFGLLYCLKPGFRLRAQRYGVAFFFLGLAFASACGYSQDSEKPNHAVTFEGDLFAAYGFATENPKAEWHRLTRYGETGYVTTLNREGSDIKVRIQVQDTKLIITGPDGKEIPVR